MSDWTFEKSNFKEKHISTNLHASDRPMSEEVFTNTFGQDRIMENITSSARRLTANNIFSNMNLAKRHLIPKKKLKSKIAQSYHAAFGNRSVSWMSEGKRAKHSKNKLKLQDHLKEEYETLASRREEEKEQYSRYITEENAAVLINQYRSPEEKEALREWAMGESTDNILLNDENMEISQKKIVSNAEDLVSENVEERSKAFERIMTVVNSIDINQFAYNSDQDFASNFAKKYELLCKGATADVFVNKFREEGGSTIQGVCIADLEAKIDMLKAYKTDYEKRMQLLRSPLYALLTSSDINDYLKHREEREAHASQELKDYINLYLDLINPMVGKRKDITNLQADAVQIRREALSGEYVQKVNAAISNIEAYKGKAVAEIIESIAQKKTGQIERDFDKEDHGFIENTPIELGKEKLMGLDTEGLKALETAVSDTIKNSATNDLGKNADLLKKTQDKFKELAESRRQYVASIKLADYLRKLKDGLGCDLNNPIFKEKDEAKILEAIRNDNTMTLMSYLNDVSVNEAQYRKQLSSLADTLKENGFNVYKGLAEPALIQKKYNEKPQIEENSTVALFDDALHANSRQSLERLRGRKGSDNADIREFFRIFKEKYSEQCGELPDEGQAQAYTEAEENHIKWILHQLVGRDELRAVGIDELEDLWVKKQAFAQENGEPVSEKLKKTVSDIFSTWRDSIYELQRKKEVMQTQIKLGEIARGNKAKIAYNRKNQENPKPKITRNREYWEDKIKGSYDRVIKLETAGKWELAWSKDTNDKIRDRIINDSERQDRRNLYMQYEENERIALRSKKTYVLSQSEPKAVYKKNQYGTLYNNSIRDVEDVLRKIKPQAYEKVDVIRTEKDPKKRTVDLYHAEGTRLLEEEGHEVIEIDVGGSSYREFSHAQNGFYGYSEGEDYELFKEYGEKYYSTTAGKEMDYIRVKSRPGVSEKAKGKKKYRYTIAGPSPETGGVSNSGDYSIEKTTKYILEIGKNHLKDLFWNWELEDLAWEKNKQGENPAEKRPKIDFLFRGHSRGGVGSVLGAMKLNYWIHKEYPQYADKVDLHLTQYDAVPGKLDDWGGYDVVDHTAQKHSVMDLKLKKLLNADYEDKEYLPLGNADTTMIYSMNTQYHDFFAAQEVRNAKRLIFTPFNHAVGLDAESTDATQLDQEGEKLHAMTFYDTTTGKAYRQSGLNHLDDGVYFMDEKHNLIKIDSVQEYIRIIQLTVPANEIKEQKIRHKSMLHAVASKFGMTDKKAEELWNQNKSSAEVLRAADDWDVYDYENKVEALINVPEMEKDKDSIKKAIKDRRTNHIKYIDKHTNKGPLRDFLKVCVEINYNSDYYDQKLYREDENKKKEKADNITTNLKKFMDAQKNIDMNALTEEEKLIVDTAADKVSDKIEAMEQQIEEMNKQIDNKNDSFVII